VTRVRGIRRGRAGTLDPFAVLGLDARTDLADEDVRSAWRRAAARTHPDRADGGDPHRFAAAAAAYNVLRTAQGRQRARVLSAGDRKPASPGTAARGVVRGSRDIARATRRWARSRPFRITSRLLITGAAAAVAILAVGPGPAGLALVTGSATWLVLAIRRDLTWRSR
jgi:hypothetical protein